MASGGNPVGFVPIQNAAVDDDEYEGEEDEYEEGEEGEDEGDEDESDDGEDEDSEEESEEDEEPKLKYQRLSSFNDVISKDAACCLAVSDKFLALGTEFGLVYILDLNGTATGKRFAAHVKKVNDLSIDANGDYVASCSDDGKVVINSLFSTNEPSVANDYQRPISAVALDPEYSRKKRRQFVAGAPSGQLVLTEKKWLNNKVTVLHAAEGPIYAVRWRASYIAWANDKGVKIYDCNLNQRIAWVNLPKGSPKPDLYRCHLVWKDDSTLIIGWGDFVQIGVIKDAARKGIESANASRATNSPLPNAAAAGTAGGSTPSPQTQRAPQNALPRSMEITAQFQTDFIVAGIAPYGNDLAMLAFVRPEEGDAQGAEGARRPELRIMTPKNEEISTDSLTIHGFEKNEPRAYSLAHLDSAVENDRMFYIVSPRDIVVARPRDLDDHVAWLLEHEMYEEALTEAEKGEKLLKLHNVAKIGQDYLNHLTQTGHFEEAAMHCRRVLGADKDLWERWVYFFFKSNQHKAIIHYIPTENPTLSRTIYEMVLNWFLNSDVAVFKRTVSQWPSKLYDIDAVIKAVEARLSAKPDDPLLLETLAELYTKAGMYGQAVEMHLRRGNPDVFNLIKAQNLFSAVQNRIVRLMEFRTPEAVALLVNNTDSIPIKQVVDQLQKHPRLLHAYLDGLFTKDPELGREYHETQVELYAEFEPAKLLSFLRESNYYSPEKALAVCRKRNLVSEMVHVLGRIGDNKEALRLIIEKLMDVERAIEFAKEQNDNELWDDLINYSTDKPIFIKGLLNNVGTHVDPILIIRRIKAGMAIPGLRDALVKILHDYNLQISLREGCKKILVSDSVALSERLYRAQRRGVYVAESTMCSLCGGYALSDGREKVALIVFLCRHVCHDHCLRRPQQSAQDKGAQAAAQQQTPARGSPAPTAKSGGASAVSSSRTYCPVCTSNQQSRSKAGKGAMK